MAENLSVSQKPRLLFASGVFTDPAAGPATILHTLVPELLRRGYACEIVTFGTPPAPPLPYPVRYTPLALPQPLRTLHAAWGMWRAARRADLVLAFDTYTHGFLAALIGRLRSQPLILRFTGDSVWESAWNRGETTDDIFAFQERPPSPPTRLRRWRRDFILTQATRIVTDCEYLRRLLVRLGTQPDKIVVIRNPVPSLPLRDPGEIRAARAAYGSDARLVLTVGRLVGWKGHRTVIEILPEIHRRAPNVHLLIAGDGPLRAPLEELARSLGLESVIHFLGTVTEPSTKAVLYAASDIFVLNTFYEGMSNTLLEAMAAGKAIVTTPVGGNPEFLNSGNAVLVSYNDGAALRNAILSLLSDPERRRLLGEEARAVASRFLPDAFQHQFITLIHATLDSHQS